MYHGNINPDALADYLVNMFDQGYGGTVAQKVGQGNQVLVQIGLLSHSGRRIRHSIGVSIYRTPDGVSVSTGQANWFDDPGLGGSLIGALYWPPLLLFPLARGINSYALYQDIWQAVDTYCAQVQCKALLQLPTLSTAIIVEWSTMKETRYVECVVRRFMRHNPCNKHPTINRLRLLQGRWYVPVVVRP
jgi:hypothetical protein